MRKIALYLSLFLVTSSAIAVNKCIVDGKVTYQAGPCLNGTSVRFEGAVTEANSSALRQQIEQEAAARQAQEIEQLKKDADLRPNNSTDISDYGAIKQRRIAARQKLYEMGLRSKTDDQLDDINRKLNSIQSQQQFNNDQQAWRNLRR